MQHTTLRILRFKISALLADMEDSSLLLESSKNLDLPKYYQGEVSEILEMVESLDQEYEVMEE